MKNPETKDLVNLLTHANRWWRLQAQRLLLERKDTSAIPSLKNIFTNHSDPRTRLHAFYALEGFAALDSKLVKQAMNDIHPGVREHGLKLSEHFPELFSQLIKMIDDSSALVTFQVCLSLGEFSNDNVLEPFSRIMERFGNDPWFQTAVLSSEKGSSLNFLELLINKKSFFQEANPEKASFLEQFSYVVVARNKAGEMLRFLKLLSRSEIKDARLRLSALTGLVNGLKKSERKPEADTKIQQALDELGENSTAEVKKAVQDLKDIFK